MTKVASAGAKEVDQRPNTHDPFWDSQQDILKTYSFNYEALTEYKQKLHRSGMCWWIFFPPALPPALVGVLTYPCDMANIRDEVKARHIALTADGLRYIVDKHPGGCRLACQDEGRSSQTVPYDKITDCDVEEPAGSEGCPCLLVKRTEYTFNVATANGPAFHSLTTRGLRGIDAPYELKKDVWSMKRGQGIAGVDTAAAVAPSFASMDRSGGQGGIGGGNSEQLLAQILQCLKEQNSILAQSKK